MKKVILLIICYIAVSSYSITQAGNPDSYKPKHEIAVRYGVVDDFFNNDFWSDWNWGYYNETPLERYNNGKYYFEDKVYTQAISLSYTRELKRWFSLSINIAYSGVFQKEREKEGNMVISEYKKHRLGIIPMARFNYLNRPMIRLYSAVGYGFGIKNESWSNTNRDNNNMTRVSGQITFFGVSVGKKIFASSEIGAGGMGYLTVGGGYRF